MSARISKENVKEERDVEGLLAGFMKDLKSLIDNPQFR